MESKESADRVVVRGEYNKQTMMSSLKTVHFDEKRFDWKAEEEKSVKRLKRRKERKAKRARMAQANEDQYSLVLRTILNESQHDDVVNAFESADYAKCLFKDIIDLAGIDTETYTTRSDQLNEFRRFLSRESNETIRVFRNSFLAVGALFERRFGVSNSDGSSADEEAARMEDEYAKKPQANWFNVHQTTEVVGSIVGSILVKCPATAGLFRNYSVITQARNPMGEPPRNAGGARQISMRQQQNQNQGGGDSESGLGGAADASAASAKKPPSDNSNEYANSRSSLKNATSYGEVSSRPHNSTRRRDSSELRNSTRRRNSKRSCNPGQEVSVCVSNLVHGTTKTMIRQAFSSQGIRIISLSTLYENASGRYVYASVTLSAVDVGRALEDVDGSIVNGSRMNVIRQGFI